MVHETVAYREIVQHNHLSCGSEGTVRRVTICSIYSSQSYDLSLQLMEQLLLQLPSPIWIAVDLNPYNIHWGV